VDPVSTFFSGLFDLKTVPYIAIVSFTVFALLRGWVVPGRTVEGRIADKNEQIQALAKERDDWKEAAKTSEEARTILVKQNSDILEQGEGMKRLMEAMRNHYEQTPPAPYQPPQRPNPIRDTQQELGA